MQRVWYLNLSRPSLTVWPTRKIFARAADRQKTGGRTLLFVDEVHRFNQAQQDGLLRVEDGTVTLVGATTENPSFALNGALLSAR